MGENNKVFVHTFPVGVPVELLKANTIPENASINIKLIVPQKTPERMIRDIAIPIMEGKVGTVRVGILEKSIQAKTRTTVKIIINVIEIFLIIGIIGAFIFAHFITKPIKAISQVADQLDFDKNKFHTRSRIRVREKFFGHFQMLFRAEDELDVLADRFNNMIDRLENAYRELQTAHAKLLSSERLASVGTMAAGIAHEINNPIAGLLNCIRRIKKNPEFIKQNQHYLSMMDESANKIEHVVRGLLDYTRHEEMIFEEININKLIKKSLTFVNYKLERSHILTSNKLQNETPSITASSNHLQQVFVNLFLNSIDAINDKSESDPTQQRQIIISSEIQNNFLEINIKDTGCGITNNSLTKIFDPFYTTKEVGKGTGLGLSVCYNIIKSHNGKIEVSSELEKGTSFTILLPLKNNNRII